MDKLLFLIIFALAIICSFVLAYTGCS